MRRLDPTPLGLAALAAAACLVLARPAGTQEPVPGARIDSIFLDLDRTDSPGCAVGVVRDGALAFADGYGSANLDHELAITPETVFYMGSVSKQFTAASVLLASRQGHLSLDDDIRTWIPELPDYGDTITVRHLVHHTSGIRDYLALQGITGSFGGVTDEEVLALLARQKALNFPPGERYLYSNSGYFLLSEILERATGRSLREFADEWFFGPLGMRHSHFHDRPNHIVRSRATGYAPSQDGGWEMNHAWDYAQVGAGGLYSNVVDMARWETAIEAGEIGDEGLAEAMLRRGVLNSGDTLSYAFGLGIREWRGLPIIAHGGALAGFRSFMVRFPDDATSMIVLCNATNANPGGRAQDLAGILLADRLAPEPEAETDPEAGPDEAEAPAWSPEAAELAGYEGRYYSEELDAELTLLVRDDTLYLDRAGDRVALQPDEPDVFRGAGRMLRFVRDDNGRITTFILDTGRANGLIFERR